MRTIFMLIALAIMLVVIPNVMPNYWVTYTRRYYCKNPDGTEWICGSVESRKRWWGIGGKDTEVHLEAN